MLKTQKRDERSNAVQCVYVHCAFFWLIQFYISNERFVRWIQLRWWLTVRGPLRISNDSCTSHRTLKHQTVRLSQNIFMSVRSACIVFTIEFDIYLLIKIKVLKSLFFSLILLILNHLFILFCWTCVSVLEHVFVCIVCLCVPHSC